MSAVTKDGTTGAATRVDVDLLDKDGKSISNVAAALASCTQCRSIAVALQAVIVPATVHNIDQILSNTVSLALNCSGCTTAAFSHIVVVASSLANPRLTPAAKAKVDDVERQLSDLDRSLPSDQLIARIDALVTQFDNTIVNGVGPAPRWTRTRTEHRES